MRPLPAVAALLLLLAAPPTFGHALLRTADPPVGSTVAAAPKELKLTFSEAVEPAFTRVEVTGAHGENEAAGSLHADTADARRVILPLKTLAPGDYTVTWHAVSVDTHRTEGRFRFTVAR